ncbi:hypothetical protein LCGC14_2576180, partial [marine sediment metagenome]
VKIADSTSQKNNQPGTAGRYRIHMNSKISNYPEDF